jgi:hypothetical protein
MNLNPITYNDKFGDTSVPANTKPIQLNPVTITPNSNQANVIPWMQFPMPNPSPNTLPLPRGINLPRIVVPAPNPILLTILLIALPVNLNDASSDHPPGPAIPKAEDLPWTPGTPPGPEWVWQGPGTPESGKGNWVNPNTGQSMHPDLNHPLPRGPHWGIKQPDKSR